MLWGQAVEEVRPLHQGVAMETQAGSVLARSVIGAKPC